MQFLYIFVYFTVTVFTEASFPIVVNTWPVINSTKAAWDVLKKNQSAVDAVVAGCSKCEADQCRGTVGAGGSPDESGETTLDAMIMDGGTMDVGAVGCLRRVKSAIAVARAVMDYTTHTLLVGNLATDFAIQMGFCESNLTTNRSVLLWEDWKSNNCQPNFRKNVTPDPSHRCGPYHPRPPATTKTQSDPTGEGNHDTIGMIAIDHTGGISAGTSTNGLSHKVPGRVGDSPIMGAGAYAITGAGGAAATGNGDVMMRFLPSYNAVLQMSTGTPPTTALRQAMSPIIKYYPSFSGAMIAVDKDGHFGAVCHGYVNWTFCVFDGSSTDVQLFTIDCKNSMKSSSVTVAAWTSSLFVFSLLVLLHDLSGLIYL